jgi:pSer/pThr/pTyr-binding forkhead associated (FHA) protein
MILVIDDGESSKTISLRPISAAAPVTIGRGTDATIRINDNSCSRVHCAIRYWDDIFIVRDMNSRNGTLLNGEKIKVAQLDAGDVLRIGATVIQAAAEQGSSTDVTILAATAKDDPASTASG